MMRGLPTVLSAAATALVHVGAWHITDSTPRRTATMIRDCFCLPPVIAAEPELIVLPHASSDSMRKHASRRGERCPQEPAIEFDPFPLTTQPIDPRAGVGLTLCAEIAKDGKVVRAWLLYGTNFPAADEAALNRLKTIRFEPASKGGKALGSRHVILIGRPSPRKVLM